MMVDLSGIAEEIAARRVGAQLDNERWYRGLLEYDPGVAEYAVRVFGSRRLAAAWAAKVKGGSGLSPIEMVAVGERDAVIDMLRRIEHGFAA